jgi:hypothetical protein
MKVRQILAAILFLTGPCIFSQQLTTVDDYIELYADLAVEEMEKHGIPASITLAQGILESSCGNSPLAREANNHFGIKCHKEWTGKTYIQDDDEKDECFRKYERVEDSYRDHSEFLATRDRYKLLFDLAITDYKGWAYGLKQAGYATNPKYPELLIKIIEENGLDKYDKVGGQQSAAGGQQSAVGSPQSTVGNEKSQSTQHSKLKNSNSKLKNSNSKLKTKDSKLLYGPPESFELIDRSESGRNVFINNGVKFIYSREGDDCQSIAADFGIYTWQIYAYNDLPRGIEIKSGQKIYLERKKKRSVYDFHVVREGESLLEISALYGIRLKVLSRINDLEPGVKLTEGASLRLK